MPLTVEFHLGKPCASVKRPHMMAAFARMLTSTPHVFEKR
jgi:hypothetical protein